ncbi:uncharacterized protein LOC129773512 [Toxorhynchites rutilus septentrionalis]|uniref:uncharacterized protein LOC129773512 n=1 Tax=Toxorhynchites rutilus septentrionalis TaxID=329112 RepID=UPI002478DFB9|nr:uncharacterized protein LOC129773512 [Toxorhynchites rutilus septentrionalis]
MPPASTSLSKVKTVSMKSLQVKHNGLQASFSNLVSFMNEYPEGTTANQIAVRLERLDDLWEKTNDIYYEIECHEDFSPDEEVYVKERSVFENRYYDVKSFLLDKARELEDTGNLNQTTRQLDATMQGVTEHVRLPMIKLQCFDGNIDEWLSFRDLFTSLIHLKPELPDVEKLHYLKGCLEGEARALIDSLKITKANYHIAWELLLKRYNNSKLLKKKQMQALFKLPTIVKESVVELRSLLEGFEKTVNTLDQITQPADFKDLLLVNILSSRLDPYTRRGWEEFSSTREQDTLPELIEFLQRRVRILEALPAKSSENKHEQTAVIRKGPTPIRVSHHAAPHISGKCPACPDTH